MSLTKHLFLSLLCLFVFTQASYAIETSAKQAIVIDYDTGQVLLSKNADERMPTSSMSKTLTAIVVFDAIKKGDLSLSDTFKVSEKAWQKGGSKMFVGLNTDVSIEDLLRGVIVQSGNDATIVLAEGISGSENMFAQQLNAKAKDIGMTNSNFVNASGWPDDNHYSTALDLARMTQYLIKTYPAFYRYFSQQSFEYNEITQNNRNPLLYQDIGADGVKTGHTEAGGYGLIGSAIAPNGRRVVMVLNGMDSNEMRAKESKKVMQWALNNFENKLLPVAAFNLPEITVAFGDEKTMTPILKNDMRITLNKNTETNNIQARLQIQSPLIAPVEMGAQIGDLEILRDGKTLAREPVFASESIKESGLFKKTFQKVSTFVHNKWMKNNG